MRTKFFRILAASGGLLLIASPVLAHHWFPTGSDQAITFSGSVTKMQWINPHARFYVDVKEDGKVTNWEIEVGSPSALISRGWVRDSVKVGDVIVVEAFRAKDGTKFAVGRNVKLPDGRTVFAGSHAGEK
jgi:hypothetical protein